MNKELLTIELRYEGVDKTGFEITYNTKVITIGIYDTLKEAITEGNKVLLDLSRYFQVRHDDYFTESHLWGMPKRLVTNSCYSTKGVSYFAKITKLEYSDLEEAVIKAFKDSGNRIKLNK